MPRHLGGQARLQVGELLAEQQVDLLAATDQDELIGEQRDSRERERHHGQADHGDPELQPVPHEAADGYPMPRNATLAMIGRAPDEGMRTG